MLSHEQAAVLAGVSIPSSSLNAEREPRSAFTVVPKPGKDIYTVRAQGIAGTLSVDELDIVVEPKIGGARAFFLTAVAAARQPDLLTSGLYREEAEFTELLADMFADELDDVLRRGVIEDYLETQEDSSTIRGRIRVDEIARRGVAVPLPMPVEYDTFGPNTSENQIVKAALQRLADMRFSTLSRSSSLRGLLPVFDGIDLVDFSRSRVPEYNIDWRNAHYERILALSEVVLRTRSIEVGAGSVRARGSLLDMARVFEDAVVRALSQRLDPQGIHLLPKAKGQRFVLDDGARYRLEPDLGVWRGRRCLFIGDVKYKDLESTEVRAADVYQMLAYATAAGLTEVTLVYPGTRTPAPISVADGRVTINIVSVDVSGSPEVFFNGIDALAHNVMTSIAQAA